MSNDGILNLSEVLIQNQQIESFEELLSVIKVVKQGSRFFRIDVKPQYADVPEDWEDRLEASFT